VLANEIALVTSALASLSVNSGETSCSAATAARPRRLWKAGPKGVIRKDGKIVAVPLAHKTRRIDFGEVNKKVVRARYRAGRDRMVG
jgi:hypothetical protein